MSQPSLVVDWCSYEAAKYAVEHWHYSRVMPTGKLIQLGVWENGRFVGSVIFGRGANNHIGSPYSLEQTEVCELVRIALTSHVFPVSKIISRSIEMLTAANPGLRLIVSYADPEQGHIGVVYQAANWLYVGISRAQYEMIDRDGTIVHKRTCHNRYGTITDIGLQRSKVFWKHKYLYPLDKAMRRQIEPLAQPYPKREHAGEVHDGA